MTPQQLELALKKQRLQMQSAALRQTLAQQASAWKPAFHVADQAQAGWRWLRRHPALPVALLVASLVARPLGVVRWARRGWFVLRTWRKFRSFVESKLPSRSDVVR